MAGFSFPRAWNEYLVGIRYIGDQVLRIYFRMKIRHVTQKYNETSTSRVLDNHTISHTEVSMMMIPHHTSWFNQASGFGPPLCCHICVSTASLGCVRSPACLALSFRPIGPAALAHTAHPPNWIQINLATKQETKPVA